ncbi:hypothetical protein Ancab_031099 [Ancistrocladus abbreviatus]
MREMSGQSRPVSLTHLLLNSGQSSIIKCRSEMRDNGSHSGIPDRGQSAMTSLSRSKQLFKKSGNIVNAWQSWIPKRRRQVDLNPSGNPSNFGKPNITKDSSFLSHARRLIKPKIRRVVA